MEKEVRLLLNRFPKLPFSLSESGKGDSPRTSLEVNLANLFHHYWLDSYGVAPPNPDPVHFEHLQFLVNTEEFRIRGSGIGEPTHIRRNRSQELGHAFCRWFLAEHLQITYFAHMSRVLNKTDNFSGCSIVRTDAGDTPDYLCAESSKKVYLAEAKARYDSIGFDTAEFDDWRQQFQRVAVEDSDGQDRVVKGFIVATRLSTEAQPNVKTTLLCEDPETRGEGGLGVEDERALASKIVSLHYSDVAIKLNQQTLSASLIQGSCPRRTSFSRNSLGIRFAIQPSSKPSMGRWILLKNRIAPSISSDWRHSSTKLLRSISTRFRRGNFFWD